MSRTIASPAAVALSVAALCWMALPAGAQTATSAPAQPVGASGVNISPDAERARISAEKTRLERGFDAESAACHEKFLVNNCLDKVTVRRQAAMGDLKRQEIYLNDQERRLKGAEQLRKIEEKRTAAGRSAESDKRSQALKDFQNRQERADQKPAEREKAAAAAQRNVDAAARKNEARDSEARARAEKQAAAAGERRKYEERQAQAAERRARHEKARKASTSTAKPLPVPP
ncbi:MAG: hypothetical protein Q7T87_15385 [Polaromonas sp.]|nr:hypothetical protein [Polaromonas sp.]